MMNRFYHPSPLKLKQKINLSVTATHHASHVLRLKVEDKIILFHNDSFDYAAIICKINKKNIEVYVSTKNKNDTHPSINFRLLQSLCSNEKMDWIIQKSVELGVNSIVPIYSDRSIIKLKGVRVEKKLLHWRQIIISACEQSGRSSLPEICYPQTLDKYLGSSSKDMKKSLKLILSPKQNNTLKSIARSSPESIDIMIGPEGGFTEQEIKHAIKEKFIPISLGPRVLRTETAPLAILSLLQYKYGDFA